MIALHCEVPVATYYIMLRSVLIASPWSGKSGWGRGVISGGLGHDHDLVVVVVGGEGFDDLSITFRSNTQARTPVCGQSVGLSQGVGVLTTWWVVVVGTDACVWSESFQSSPPL